MGDSTTNNDSDWVSGIEWGRCPGWCTRNPDPTVDLADGGHMTDLQAGGTAVRYHDHRWPLPDAEAPKRFKPSNSKPSRPAHEQASPNSAKSGSWSTPTTASTSAWRRQQRRAPSSNRPSPTWLPDN